MAAIQGVSRRFHKRFKFLIEIDGIVSAGFQTCSEIAVEVAKIEHHEGGSLIPHKSPGRVTVPDVTLTRGATSDLDFYEWVKETVALGAILEDDDLKRHFDVVEQNRAGAEVRRWKMFNAFITRWTPGEWDNNVDENTMEKIVLAYDFATLGGDSGGL